MPEKSNFEQFKNQPEREIKKDDVEEMEEIELSEEDIEILPDEVARETVETMGTEAEAVIQKGEEEMIRIDEKSGLNKEELVEAKQKTGADEEMKSFGQKVGEALGRAKEKIYGLFGKKEESEKKPDVVFEGVFDPEEELKQIRQLPREEKRQALEEFKEKLAAQKEGLSKLQSEIINEFKGNPDATHDELMNKIKKEGTNYGITDKQIDLASEIIKNFQAEHQRVKELREEFPDDNELFKAMYGRLPAGKVEAEIRPTTILFKIYDENDFAYVVGANRSQKSIVDISETDKRKAEVLRGSCIPWNLDALLNNTLIVNMSNSNNLIEKGYNEVINHEEQHAFNTLFTEAKSVSNAKQELLNSQTDTERETALYRYFTDKRRAQGDTQAKDEIMAFYTGEEAYSPEKITDILTYSDNITTYSYFEKALDILRQHLGKDLIPKMGKERFDEMTEKLFHKVFEDEYKKVIQQGAQAFDDLRKKGGFKTSEIVGMLTHEPLRKWPLTAKRMLEQKK